MDELEAAYRQAERMIADAIKRCPSVFWAPGAWTPARCHLARALTTECYQRLNAWVRAEKQKHPEGAKLNHDEHQYLPPLDAIKEAVSHEAVKGAA